jgi:hypothetical protein
MKNLKNESLVTIGTNAWYLRGWRILLALVLLAATFAAVPAQSALADSGKASGDPIDVTFTKWVTSLPANPPSMAGVLMAGVVGGAVGEGDFAGKVILDDSSVPGFWLAKARYGFIGERHSFTAVVNVKQNNALGTATITGHVTKGWLKGAIVTGGYKVMPTCPIETPGNIFGEYGLCFQGTLRLIRNSDH